MTAKGATDTKLLDEDNFALLGDSVFGIFGTDATSKSGWEVLDSAPTTEQNLVDFLATVDAKNLLPGSGYPGGSFPSFTTVLEAIKLLG